MNKQKLRELIGNLPKESGFKKKMRFHQSWWRTFVLGEKQGQWPKSKDPQKRIGSTIMAGKDSGKNFLTDNSFETVRITLEERKEFQAGIMEEDRLYNNLLSSQPLCFNFFGELKLDLDFALRVIKCFFPDITRVNQVWFEFAPRANHTSDNSAFDIALEVERKDQTGLIGLECKFTDKFSPDETDKAEYKNIFDKSGVFKNKYKTYIVSRFNQLFRNQLMAEAMVQEGDYDFVYTGLVCHDGDNNGNKIGKEFASLLELEQEFQIITYREYVSQVQQLPLTWEQREWTMLLWARYCSTNLSDKI